MKKLIVAGIVGTMLAFSTSTPASAREFHLRPGVSYTSRYLDSHQPYRYSFDRYSYLDRDNGDRFGCDRGIRYPWPTYDRDHYHPRLTYRW
jgi:hypothetical protein